MLGKAGAELRAIDNTSPVLARCPSPTPHTCCPQHPHVSCSIDARSKTRDAKNFCRRSGAILTSGGQGTPAADSFTRPPLMRT
eukprot:106649-Rhodomonas_salina.1